MPDYQNFYNFIISMVEDPTWKEANKDGISLGHLNTLIESGIDFGDIPFPERTCSKCHKYYRIDTIIQPVRICSNCQPPTFQNSTEQSNVA